MRAGLAWVGILVLGPACGGADWCERFNFDCLVEEPYEIDPGGDADQDGWVASEDCDDQDAEVFPGAAEVCDGEDNDCDALVDEGTGGLQDWWIDEDGDGYGDPLLYVEACERPPGGVDNDEDCNDASAQVNPREKERCDDTDRDCDGDPYEGAVDAVKLYPDGDGDGYGADSGSMVGCPELDVGFVEVGGDCDDGDDSVHPGATERCDEVDQDCDGDTWDPESVNAKTWYQDADRDGFGNEDVTIAGCKEVEGFVEDPDDCDDTNADTFPGAPECDDRDDNDCDGLIDEGELLSPVSWYEDSDDDGYGAAVGATIERCLDPYRFCDNTLDCDDEDPANFPGNTEVCDGGDNDCDELVDDADDSLDTSTWLSWYWDDDGDGYGDPAGDMVEQCAEPEGYAGNAEDCDDGDPERYPEAPEVCEDGVIQACEEDEDLALAECSLLRDATLEEGADWWVVGNVEEQNLGHRVAADGDLDGDGLADLVVSAQTVVDGAMEGGVYLFHGYASGEESFTEAFASITGSEDGRRLGAALLAGHDLDGDGFDDLVVGADGDASGPSSGVWIFLGPLSGALDTDDADQVLQPGSLSEAPGGALALGDLDGDGDEELVVGAFRTSGGEVYVVDVPLSETDDLESCCVTVDGSTWHGTAVSVVGDIDGDGVNDLAVANYRELDATTPSVGAVWLFTGPITADLDTDDAWASLVGTASYYRLGTALHAPGDVDGDGLADLAVGADSNLSPFHLFTDLQAGELDATKAHATATSARASGGVYALDSGDLDGDGVVDFALGLPDWPDERGHDFGAALVLVGPLTGTLDLESDPGASFLSAEVGGQAGHGLAVGADADGARQGELLVGAPGARLDGAFDEAGAVFLLRSQGY